MFKTIFVKITSFFSQYKDVLYVERTSPNAYFPVRGTPKSSGLDFFSPIDVTIQAGNDELIPLDIKIKLPKGTDLTFFNKSGVATKKKLVVGACVCDEDYTGIIHAHLFNLGEEPVTIKKGDKIVQGIIRKVERPFLLEVPVVSFESERGSGGFGSTGDKHPTAELAQSGGSGGPRSNVMLTKTTIETVETTEPVKTRFNKEPVAKKAKKAGIKKAI